MSAVPTAVAAELVVVIAIFVGAATYINFDAILNAIVAWGSW